MSADQGNTEGRECETCHGTGKVPCMCDMCLTYGGRDTDCLACTKPKCATCDGSGTEFVRVPGSLNPHTFTGRPCSACAPAKCATCGGATPSHFQRGPNLGVAPEFASALHSEGSEQTSIKLAELTAERDEMVRVAEVQGEIVEELRQRADDARTAERERIAGIAIADAAELRRRARTCGKWEAADLNDNATVLEAFAAKLRGEGAWTQDEVDEIKRRAKQTADELEWNK